jgi:hypothetical protein
MTDTLELQATLLAASVEDRTVKYRILPYGVPGNTSKGRVIAAQGLITLPDDLSSLALNDRHIGDRVLASCTELTDSADGLTASFQVHPGQAGDDLLDECNRARTGNHPGVELRASASVELTKPIIRAGKLLGGYLSAVAAVVRPAFAGSTLLAADAGELPDDFPEYLLPTESTSESTEEIVVNGVTYVVKRTTTSTQTVDPKNPGETTEAPPTPDAGDETPGETVTASLTASAPTGMQGLPGAGDQRKHISTAADFGKLMAAYHTTHDRDLLAAIMEVSEGADELFAALTDIKWDGTGGLSQTISQPQWLGNVWNNKKYQRKIIPLLSSDTLTSLTLKGWKWGTKPVVAAWSGNKSAVPSGTVTADAVNGTATRYAGAHDIAREFRDFGSAEFWEAYISAMTESYAEVTDLAAGAALLAAATDVEPGTVPTDVPDALVYIVDGVLSMLDIASPSWALVAPDLWRELVLTPVDGGLNYLSSALSMEEGALENFRILPWTGLDAGSVLVGDRAAATFLELPGSPIRVSAENIANGGIDEGFFGYAGTVINEPLGLALVAPVIP